MNKKRLYNLSLIVALIVALSCIMTLGVYAKGDEGESSSPIEWEAPDENTIVDSEGNKYVHYELPLGAFRYRDTQITYYNSVETEDDYSPYVYSTSWGCGIITLSNYELYATEEQRQKLDAFFEGNINYYRIFDDKYTPGSIDKVADVDKTFVNALEREYGEAYNTDKVMIEVTELDDREAFSVFGRDDTLTVGYIVGTIFELDDGYYYVDHSYLENNHFDASGYLSFRSGSLPLCKLSQESAKAIDHLKGELTEHECVEEEEYDPTDSFAFIVAGLLLILFAILVNGIIIPIPFIVLGIIMANRKPRTANRYWYRVSAFALAWLILAALLAIVITLIILM